MFPLLWTSELSLVPIFCLITCYFTWSSTRTNTMCALSRAARMFSRSSIRSLGPGNTYKYQSELSLSLELPKCSVVHPSFHWVQETRTSTMSALSRAAQVFSRSSIRSLGSGNTYKYHVCTLSSCPNVQSFIYPFIGPRKHLQVPVCTLSLSSCPNI